MAASRVGWKKALEKLDIHWARGDKDETWHLAGIHSCGDHHALCDSHDIATFLPDVEGDPADTQACPKCLFSLGRMLSPLVHKDSDRAALHRNLVALQENIRLREYVQSVKN